MGPRAGAVRDQGQGGELLWAPVLGGVPPADSDSPEVTEGPFCPHLRLLSCVCVCSWGWMSAHPTSVLPGTSLGLWCCFPRRGKCLSGEVNGALEMVEVCGCQAVPGSGLRLPPRQAGSTWAALTQEVHSAPSIRL